MDFKKGIYSSMALAALLNFAMASGIGGVTSLTSALYQFCAGIKGIVPIAAMLMIFGAAVLYAIGQLMGAETRARANVWATAMFTGAIIGILIVVITPSMLNYIYGSVSGGVCG